NVIPGEKLPDPMTDDSFKAFWKNDEFRNLAADFLVPPVTAAAGDKPNFSGSYLLTGSKGAFKFKKGTSQTVQVVQTESTIEITRTTEGLKNVNNTPLDGTEGVYNSPGGPRGKCAARFKGKSLVLDTLVVTRPQPKGPDVQIHTRERWELSSDSKTLTIRSDVDFPGSPVNDFQLIEPWTEIYSRQ
ncbi:MAG: hypothetical protein ABSE57_01570, partial [Bryobacteraceae bacterium]